MMDPRDLSNVKIKREVDSFTLNCCDEDRDAHRAGYPDHESAGGNPYSCRSSINCEDGRGRGTQENHMSNPLKVLEHTQGISIPREEAECSPYQMHDAITVPSDGNISQSTTGLVSNAADSRRRKRRLPSRFQNEYLDTEAKRTSPIISYSSGLHHHLISPPPPLTAFRSQEHHYSHTQTANQVNTCPPTSFQQSPIIGKAFHVDTFTPGPLEQIIVRQPGESYLMVSGNQYHSEPVDKQAKVEVAPRIDSGFSDNCSRSDRLKIVPDGSKSDGVNYDSGGGLSNGESWKMDEMEEERQWSQVQWYRDLKKQNPTRIKRGNNRTEPTTFMRCNELKERRNRERQTMMQQKPAWEARASPMNQHCGKSDGSASADADYQGVSSKHHPSHEQSSSQQQGYQERAITTPVGAAPRQNTGTRNASPNKHPSHCSCCAPQSCGILMGLFITQENRAESRCRKEDKSEGEEDTSSRAKHSKEFLEEPRDKAKESQDGESSEHSKEFSEDAQTSSLQSHDTESSEHSKEISNDAQTSLLESRPLRNKARGFHDRLHAGKNDVVCQVNGLFALPGGFKETKYKITLDELRRRTGHPENLTRVEMISYVRQAKLSGRILLDRHHLIAANHSKPTILSRVCEGEARVLADGIHEMNVRYLPMHSLAGKTVREFRQRECRGDQDCGFKLQRRVFDMEITRNVLKEMKNVLVDQHHEGQLQEFQLASHNFGVANLSNNLNLLDKYFDTLMQRLQEAAGNCAR